MSLKVCMPVSDGKLLSAPNLYKIVITILALLPYLDLQQNLQFIVN